MGRTMKLFGGYADEKCPVCGTPNELDGAGDVEFYNGKVERPGIHVYKRCHECGARYTLVYTLDWAYIEEKEQ